MRILHLVEAHTIHTQRIAEYQVGQGHDVLVLTFHDRVGKGGVREIRRNPWVTKLPYHHHWTGILEFAVIANDFGPDLIHGHYLSTAALYLAVPTGSVAVGSVVGSDVLVDIGSAHAKLLVQASRQWVNRYTSVAPHVTRRMVELGIPIDRIETFPWGVDLEVFHPTPGVGRQPVIVSTRNFEPVYDIGLILEAFDQVALKVPDATLRLFGEGSGGPWLRSRARQIHGTERISFEGRADSKILSGALRTALVYVSASKSDGASASLLESMSVGIIPVVTDIEANREWITNGENGILFPVGDSRALAFALETALQDHELALRCLATNPRIVAERASVPVSMARLEKVYREALAS